MLASSPYSASSGQPASRIAASTLCERAQNPQAPRTLLAIARMTGLRGLSGADTAASVSTAV